MYRLSVADVIAKQAAHIMAMDGVVGMAEGLHNGQACIQIHLARDDEALRQALPAELDGYPVVILVTGEAELL